MNGLQKIEDTLRKYKYNKARLSFLESQLKRLVPETHEDYIMSKAFKPGQIGAAPIFIIENNAEVAMLNRVEETAGEYRTKCQTNYSQAKTETQKEYNQLNYMVSIVEDGLNLLENINLKYKIIIEKHYINSVRMEDIAENMHISRSRCYELCKEAVLWMTKVVYGENTAV